MVMMFFVWCEELEEPITHHFDPFSADESMANLQEQNPGYHFFIEEVPVDAEVAEKILCS